MSIEDLERRMVALEAKVERLLAVERQLKDQVRQGQQSDREQRGGG
jgi:uncharacterized small protein (DUF1192 family)